MEMLGPFWEMSMSRYSIDFCEEVPDNDIPQVLWFRYEVKFRKSVSEPSQMKSRSSI